MSRAPLWIMLGVLAVVRVAAADPCKDSSALRADLEQESRRADHWELAWRIVYTVSAVGELGIAASGVTDHDNTHSLWVGGVKSSIAALGHWFTPLRIKVPRAIGDACADRAALRAAAERAADAERDAFWTSHVGGLVLNIGGMLVLAETTSWNNGLVSFATGYAVGLLTTYTMPRASWHRVREPSWTWAANVVITPERYALVVGGSF